MHYSADTLAAYEALFGHAHEALVKEAWGGARRFERLGKAIQRRMGGKLLRSAEAEAATEKEVAEALRQKSIKQDLDAAVLQNQNKLLQRNFANEFGQKASPEMFDQVLQQNQRYKQLGLAGLGLGGAATAVGVPLAYSQGRQSGEGDRTRTRNIAFGVGAASGLAAPHVIQGLGQIARGVGGTGLFPGLQAIPPDYASNFGYGGGY